MRAVLLAVKDLRLAKQRLAPCLPQSARTGLAAAMMEDVFTAVASARGFDAVFVASSSALVLERASSLGWQALPEAQQISESDSVDRASRELAARGVSSVLRLPIDVPLVTAADIEELFAASKSAACVLVPSRDGRGTNALLRTPPGLFPSHFGPDSLRQHLEEASAAGAEAQIIKNARLALDVDDADDLRALIANCPAHTATGRWLARHARALPLVSASVRQAQSRAKERR
jgi:2-phospho-L-lactate guanylyltransferase